MNYIKYSILFLTLFVLQSCSSDRKVFCTCGLSRDVTVLNNTAKSIDIAVTVDFFNYTYLRSLDPFGMSVISVQTNCNFNISVVGGDSTFYDALFIDPCLKDRALILEIEN